MYKYSKNWINEIGTSTLHHRRFKLKYYSSKVHKIWEIMLHVESYSRYWKRLRKLETKKKKIALKSKLNILMENILKQSKQSILENGRSKRSRVLYSWKPDYGCCRGSLLITAQHLGGQIKRMSAGKTISLYLESQERSLPPSACPRRWTTLWTRSPSPLSSSHPSYDPFIRWRSNGSWQFTRY